MVSDPADLAPIVVTVGTASAALAATLAEFQKIGEVVIDRQLQNKNILSG